MVGYLSRNYLRHPRRRGRQGRTGGGQGHTAGNSAPSHETMEYERALFRVYDKSMEGFHSPVVRSTCNLLRKLFLVVSAGLFATLVLLHHHFVNNPGMCCGRGRERELCTLHTSCCWLSVGVSFDGTSAGKRDRPYVLHTYAYSSIYWMIRPSNAALWCLGRPLHVIEWNQVGTYVSMAQTAMNLFSLGWGCLNR